MTDLEFNTLYALVRAYGAANIAEHVKKMADDIAADRRAETADRKMREKRLPGILASGDRVEFKRLVLESTTRELTPLLAKVSARPIQDFKDIVFAEMVRRDNC